ncbi:broad substrate specificity ATP-binding cassette transporter ABCG2c [Hoplias malabaricus]|uniref:broad substrate specificity ATP-binding cassette transporter ABCG2c n=1 Tax=Hoplias malabaricus TaxID=27720 RepID=UPI003463159D
MMTISQEDMTMDVVVECEPPPGDSESSALSCQAPGPSLSFHNVRYCIKERAGMFSRKWVEKEILKNVSGIMNSGMNAILGPTGSGKTSLLDVIAGRKDPQGLKSGQVLVDNALVTSSLRLSSAYVVQNDVIMGTLTVRENLAFSANLRLSPAKYTPSDKATKVESVIQELGLTDCADTKIGTEFLRGVSGGERKRCSIGMELITSPSLLFLDEPTTGLDANTANAIIALLHKLSRNGKTIIFSIHQPRYSIFRQFDHLTLMNKGEIIYAGSADKAISYFEGLGYRCEPFNNPADFFLDVINETFIPQADSAKPENMNGVELMASENALAVKYRQSPQCRRVIEQLQGLTEGLNPESKSASDEACYVTPFYYQLMLLSARTVKNILRNPQTSYAQLFLNIFFGILVGLIYYQIPHTLPEALQNRTGAFFFLVINMVFGNLSAVELFISERVLFIHENSSGYYRTSVYFLSKVFADLLPNRILPVFIFSAIPYFMMALKPEVEAFFLFCFTMSLISLSAVSLAFLVSASVGSFAMANILIALPYVFMMVFGGFLVNLNSMLSWMSWLKWISIFRYGFNALAINELKGLVFTSNYTRMTGEMYLDHQEIDYSSWGFWQNQVALGGIMCVCLVMAYIQLRRINRWK